MPSKNHRKPANSSVSAALSVEERTRLLKFAQAHNVTPSAVVRAALTAFLDAEEQNANVEYESLVERRLQNMENRLATLIARYGRASAQTMFFVLTPFTKGGWPTARISEKQFSALWNEARLFSAEWLKKANLPEQIVPDEGPQGEIA